ncbi:hypothetical protein [Gordonia sp. VNK21]|uniref:hypothetical protein n=1 Tax=Gordonia sp. VNK21 TaxID=3382483 RepID=UPI0038D50EBA
MQQRDIAADIDRDTEIERYVTVGGAQLLVGGLALAAAVWWLISETEKPEYSVSTDTGWILQLMLGLIGLAIFTAGVQRFGRGLRARSRALREDSARLWLDDNGRLIRGTVDCVEHTGGVTDLVVIYDDPESGLRHRFRHRLGAESPMRSGESVDLLVDAEFRRYRVFAP